MMSPLALMARSVTCKPAAADQPSARAYCIRGGVLIWHVLPNQIKCCPHADMPLLYVIEKQTCWNLVPSALTGTRNEHSRHHAC